MEGEPLFLRQGNGLGGDPLPRARVRLRMLRRGLVKTKLLHKASQSSPGFQSGTLNNKPFSLSVSLACLLAGQGNPCALALRLCRVWSVGVRHAWDRRCEVKVFSPFMPMSCPRLGFPVRADPLSVLLLRAVSRIVVGDGCSELCQWGHRLLPVCSTTPTACQGRSPGVHAVTFAGSLFQVATPRSTCYGLWFRLTHSHKAGMADESPRLLLVHL